MSKTIGYTTFSIIINGHTFHKGDKFIVPHTNNKGTIVDAVGNNWSVGVIWDHSPDILQWYNYKDIEYWVPLSKHKPLRVQQNSSYKKRVRKNT